MELGYPAVACSRWNGSRSRIIIMRPRQVSSGPSTEQEVLIPGRQGIRFQRLQSGFPECRPPSGSLLRLLLSGRRIRAGRPGWFQTADCDSLLCFRLRSASPPAGDCQSGTDSHGRWHNNGVGQSADQHALGPPEGDGLLIPGIFCGGIGNEAVAQFSGEQGLEHAVDQVGFGRDRRSSEQDRV